MYFVFLINVPFRVLFHAKAPPSPVDVDERPSPVHPLAYCRHVFLLFDRIHSAGQQDPVGFRFHTLHMWHFPERPVQEGLKGAAQGCSGTDTGNGHPLHE